MKRIGNMELTHESSPDIAHLPAFPERKSGRQTQRPGSKDMLMLRHFAMLLERKEGFIRYALDETDKDKVRSSWYTVTVCSSTCWQQRRQAGKKCHDLPIDSVLQEYAEKEKLFDFEGSTLPGIANFYSNFGAQG